MKRAGWRFDPEGASRAASKSRRTVAAEISSCLNLRMLLREAIMSDNSTVAPPWKYYEANSTTSSRVCQMVGGRSQLFVYTIFSKGKIANDLPGNPLPV